MIQSIENRFKSDQYTLLEKIGEGGFGQIYQAKQIATNQLVAIKFLTLHSQFDEEKNQRYVERFERETYLSARLQHPNVVRLLDKGRCDKDLLFAVFEYVEGRSLKQALMDSGSLSPSTTAEIMSQVLDALAHAHAQGVIHRDIKPANIMITENGAKIHVKILDFGIGTLVSEARKQDYKNLTLTHEALGTPSYSAPEQLRGEVPTPQTDLYVWGLVFIEYLTGQPAVTGTSIAAIFHKQLSQANIPLPVAIAGHPVASLLRRVLNKHPEERAFSADSVYQELRRINFSSLVGDIGQSQEPHPALVEARHFDNGETYIHSKPLFQSNIIERKPISVLCLKLKSVNASDSFVDSDLIDALVRDQKSQCIDIAIRYGAYHMGSLADTLLFYFGYPNVSDNDSRLASRAALEISSNLRKKSTLLQQTHDLDIQFKAGLHTGKMTIYADSAPEGETANIAIELAHRAEGNCILCSQQYQHSLRHQLEFVQQLAVLQSMNQKAIHIYALKKERQIEAFGFLRSGSRKQSFIGREQELQAVATILANMQAETALRFQATHIVGEAGVGKSRLLFESRNSSFDFPHIIIQHLPEHRHNALYAILAAIKSLYAIDTTFDSTAELKLRKSYLTDLTETEEEHLGLSVLLTWLQLPVAEEFCLANLPSEKQKALLFQAIARILNNTHGLDINTLLIFEDLHWADPMTIEFIEHLKVYAQTDQKNVHVISTSRLPLPQILQNLDITTLELTRLSNDQTSAFIEDLFQKQEVSKRVIDAIIDRTDGIPLFVEEMVEMLKQNQWVVHRNGINDFTDAAHVGKVPTTLMELLQQKLDLLTHAKITAQIASVIGREFEFDILLAISEKHEDQLQLDLLELMEFDLIYRQRQVAGDIFIFKHAMVRDAAYESMLNAQKILTHKKVAEMLMRTPAININSIEIARHYSAAEEYSLAVKHGISHLEKCSEQNVSNQIIHYFERISTWNRLIDDIDLAITNEIQLAKVAIPAHNSQFGYASEQVRDICINTLNSITKAKKTIAAETIQYFKRVTGLNQFLSLHHSPNRKEARELGENLLAQYRDEQDIEGEVVLLAHMSQSYMFDGELKRSIQLFEYTINTYVEHDFQNFATIYGIDILPHCYGMVSLSYLHIGEIDTALELSNKAVQYSNTNVSLTVAYIFRILCLSLIDNKQQALTDCEYYYNNIFKTDDPIYYKSYIDLMYQVALGNPQTSFAIAREIINSAHGFAMGWYLPLIAKEFLRKNDPKNAMLAAELAVEQAFANAEIASIPIALNTKAFCLKSILGKNANEVLTLIQQSLAIAEKQEAQHFISEAKQLTADMVAVT